MLAFQLINVRKLAAVDMAWLGSRVIVAEYALGVLLPLALGILSVGRGLGEPEPVNRQVVFGIWLVTIAANYVPLFLYALAIACAGTVQVEGQPELKRARRYGIQQVMILVPLFVVGLALIQERGRRRQRQGRND
jgi:hypothetical protein